EFHRLKRGFVPTYDRWARPIDIDVDLRKDFPNRGKSLKSGNGAPGHSKGSVGPVKSLEPSLVTHRGGCHCRRVRFEVDAPAELEVLDCNCSICRMAGFLHLIVAASRFRLLSRVDH